VTYAYFFHSTENVKYQDVTLKELATFPAISLQFCVRYDVKRSLYPHTILKFSKVQRNLGLASLLLATEVSQTEKKLALGGIASARIFLILWKPSSMFFYKKKKRSTPIILKFRVFWD
jgi:hypothetical protein